MWFKNRRAKFRQQNKQQQGTQSKPKPATVKRKSPAPDIQQVQEPGAAAKSPVQVPPQQFSNFSLNASTWSPNKHNIQEMANFHRQANYQKFINNGINGFSSNNFNTTSSQPPHFHPSHEQYFSYMANSGPVTNELSRNRIVDSSAMMC